MSKLLLLAASLLLVALWLISAPLQVPAAATGPFRAARPAPVHRDSLPFLASAASAVAAAPEAKFLAGEALAHRLDDEIPMELYGQAAHCYQGGLPADQKLDVTYRLKVVNGSVSVSEAGVTSGNLGDGALQRCIVDRVLAYQMHDDRMPDLDEEGEVFLRVGGFKPFLAQVPSAKWENGDEPPHL